MIGTFTIVMAVVGAYEPVAALREPFLILNVLASWFVFPRHLRWAPRVATVLTTIVMFWMVWFVRTQPRPEQMPGFDLDGIAVGNLLIALIATVFYCTRALSEADLVNEELRKERARSEALLKREVAHQVAERSRDLGRALSTADSSAAALAPSSRFAERYKVIRPLGEGAMGSVYEVERVMDGQRYALKLMTTSPRVAGRRAAPPATRSRSASSRTSFSRYEPVPDPTDIPRNRRTTTAAGRRHRRSPRPEARGDAARRVSARGAHGAATHGGRRESAPRACVSVESWCPCSSRSRRRQAENRNEDGLLQVSAEFVRATVDPGVARSMGS